MFRIKIVQPEPKLTLYFTEIRDDKVWGDENLNQGKEYQTKEEADAEIRQIKAAPKFKHLALGRVRCN